MKRLTILVILIMFAAVSTAGAFGTRKTSKSPHRIVQVGLWKDYRGPGTVLNHLKIEVFRFDEHWHYYDATWDRITFWKGDNSVKIDVNDMKMLLFAKKSGYKFDELTKHVTAVMKDNSQHHLVLVMGDTTVTGLNTHDKKGNGHNWRVPVSAIKIIVF